MDNLTQSNFVNVQPDGSLKPNPEFGTYKKTSDSPLTVEYTFDENAVWSDGVPIDCDDAMLAWAAHVEQLPDRNEGRRRQRRRPVHAGVDQRLQLDRAAHLRAR